MDPNPTSATRSRTPGSLRGLSPPAGIVWVWSGQLAMTGTLPQVHPARPGDPLATSANSTMFLFFVPYLHFAKHRTPRTGSSEPAIVIDDVGEEFCHGIPPNQSMSPRQVVFRRFHQSLPVIVIYLSLTSCSD